MNKNTTIRTLILAAAVSLGATAALAQDANVAVPNPADTAPSGLLGARYTDVAYKFINIEGPDNAHGFAIGYNQPLAPGFDFAASYDWAEVDFGPVDATVQDLELGLKAFSTNYAWAKPYILAAVGWEWQKVGGFRDDSFFYKVGIGAEFQAAPSFVITPFANYVRTTEFDADEVELGAKVAYRINQSWDIVARAQYEIVDDDADTTEYSLGALYRF